MAAKRKFTSVEEELKFNLDFTRRNSDLTDEERAQLYIDCYGDDEDEKANDEFGFLGYNIED